MNSPRPLLGTCPACRADIPRGCELIEYQRGNERAVYAECPNCADVVHPEAPPRPNGDD